MDTETVTSNPTDRKSLGAAVLYTGKRVWVPSGSIAGDRVDYFVAAARAHDCAYILWNDIVRGIDSDYGW